MPATSRPATRIRLGGLRITIERESARDEDPGDESTVYLTGSPASPLSPTRPGTATPVP